MLSMKFERLVKLPPQIPPRYHVHSPGIEKLFCDRCRNVFLQKSAEGIILVFHLIKAKKETACETKT